MTYYERMQAKQEKKAYFFKQRMYGLMMILISIVIPFISLEITLVAVVLGLLGLVLIVTKEYALGQQ